MAADLPDAETIRRTAEDVLSRPEYRPDELSEEHRSLLAQLAAAFQWVLDKLTELGRLIEGLPVPVQWIIRIALVALLALLVWHIGYTMVRAMRQPERAPRPGGPAGRSRDPRQLEQQAEEASQRGEYIEAVRLLFRASILRLENAERKTIRPGTTNRELLRRYRTTPLHDPLQQFVRVIDHKWYGEDACGPEDYTTCHEAHQTVRKLARRVMTPAPGTRASPPGTLHP